ncbi:MAG: hypothetical protein WAQ22_01625 [Candidatus Saccharimonas sp.]
MLKQTQIRHIWYKIRHDYLQLNAIVLAVALLIAAYWAWESVSRMQLNYTQQRAIDAKQRELKLTELETETLQYQKNYYESDEYKDLAAREKLGLAAPGEKVLILPKNSLAASEPTEEKVVSAKTTTASNFEQWIDFLFGGTAKNAKNK